MGNCFKRCFGDDPESGYAGGRYPGHGYGGQEGGDSYSPPGPITYTVDEFPAVHRDLVEFEATNKVCFSFSYDFRNACLHEIIAPRWRDLHSS